MSEAKLFCGMDISKGRAEVALVDASCQHLGQSRQFLDTPEGRKKLCLWLKQQAQQRGVTRMDIGMEPTGGYERHFQHILQHWNWDGIQVQIRQLPTTVVEGQHQTTGQRTHTDPTSAWTLAEALQRYPLLKTPILTAFQRAVRRWIGFIERDAKHARALDSQLQQLLYETIPFVLPFYKQTPQWLLRLLAKYPSAQQLAQLSHLPEIPFAPKDKLEKILEQARLQVADLPQDRASERLVQQLARGLRRKKREVKRQQQALVKEAENLPDWKRIQRWLGIGDIGKYTAVAVYVGLFLGGKAYDDAAKLEKAAGLDIKLFESGDKIRVKRISKRGPGYIRRVLYLAAIRLIKSPGVFQDYYQQLLQRRGRDMKVWALVAVMKKLLRVMWALWTQEKNYQANHEALWKAAHPIVQPQVPPIDPAVKDLCALPNEELHQAPLSRRMRKKVEKQLQRQQLHVESQTLEPQTPQPQSVSPLEKNLSAVESLKPNKPAVLPVENKQRKTVDHKKAIASVEKKNKTTGHRKPVASLRKKERKTTGRKKALPLNRQSPSSPPLPINNISKAQPKL